MLCWCDGSVIEQPESRQLAATGPVLSSTAKRVNRSRVLFHLPTLRPIRVMGRDWTGTSMTGLEGIPQLASMRWWTSTGDSAEQLRAQEEQVLRLRVRTWGPLLTCVFARGSASGPWLEVRERLRVRCISRWIKKHLLYDPEGRAKTVWEMGRGKSYLAHQLIRASSSGLTRACDLWWAPVRHPTDTQHLDVVKARLTGKGW